MSHTITARISIRLPDDAKAQADLAASVLTAWKTFVAAAGNDGIAELRIAPEAEVVRRRRGRPRRPFVVAPEAAE
jgi:hypothetical protein